MVGKSSTRKTLEVFLEHSIFLYCYHYSRFDCKQKYSCLIQIGNAIHQLFLSQLGLLLHIKVEPSSTCPYSKVLIYYHIYSKLSIQNTKQEHQHTRDLRQLYLQQLNKSRIILHKRPKELHSLPAKY